MTSAGVLFSGGKDSVFATYLAQAQGMAIKMTLTIIPYQQDSYMFHVPNSRFASVVSGAMGLKSRIIEMTEPADELEVLTEGIRSLGVDLILTGAVASEYQSSRIARICESLGIDVMSPLWHMDEEGLLREMVASGFEIVMVGAAAEGIGKDWLGRRIDEKAIDDLLEISRKRKIHIAGEGGEFETIVLDGPNFKKRIEIPSSEPVWKGQSGHLQINALSLFDKTQ